MNPPAEKQKSSLSREQLQVTVQGPSLSERMTIQNPRSINKDRTPSSTSLHPGTSSLMSRIGEIKGSQENLLVNGRASIDGPLSQGTGAYPYRVDQPLVCDPFAPILVLLCSALRLPGRKQSFKPS